MREALGIAVGDKVSTSYGSDPYVVDSIWGPFWWWTWLDGCGHDVTIWQYPVISLSLTRFKSPKTSGCGINHIHQDGNRWFTDQGDEVFVEKRSHLKQLDIFELFSIDVDNDPRKKPYVFKPGIDYSCQGKVFKCKKCFEDFNGEKWNGGFTNPFCPVCGPKFGVSMSIFIMDVVVPGQRYWSSYQRSLGYAGSPASQG